MFRKKWDVYVANLRTKQNGFITLTVSEGKNVLSRKKEMLLI